MTINDNVSFDKIPSTDINGRCIPPNIMVDNIMVDNIMGGMQRPLMTINDH